MSEDKRWRVHPLFFFWLDIEEAAQEKMYFPPEIKKYFSDPRQRAMEDLLEKVILDVIGDGVNTITQICSELSDCPYKDYYLSIYNKDPFLFNNWERIIVWMIYRLVGRGRLQFDKDNKFLVISNN